MRRLMTILAALSLGGCLPHATQFQRLSRFGAGRNPVAAVPADINGDGKMDLLVTKEWSRGELAVLLGNGDGSFRPTLNMITGYAPKRPVLEDFNGDGKRDLVVMDLVEGGYVSIMLGHGDGTFGAPAHFACGRSPSSLKTTDLNGDGKLDLVLTNYRPDDFGVTEYFHGNLTILFGHGDGTFSAPDTRDLGSGPRAVAGDDLNHDGKLDLVVADDAQHWLHILFGSGDGHFTAGPRYRLPFGGLGVSMYDLNKDGKPDLLIGTFQGVTVFLGNGDGTFEHLDDTYCGATRNVVAADFDGDGNLDLVGARSLLMGDGTGHFKTVAELDRDNDDAGVAAADFNGDGRPDVVVTDRVHSRIGVYLNVGAGAAAPAPAATTPAPAQPSAPQKTQEEDDKEESAQ